MRAGARVTARPVTGWGAGMRRLAGWVRRWYGARPLHLLALLAAFALAGYAVRGVVAAGQWRGFALWFAVAIVGHDLLLFPLYSLADLSLRRLLPGRPGRRDVGAAGPPGPAVSSPAVSSPGSPEHSFLPNEDLRPPTRPRQRLQPRRAQPGALRPGQRGPAPVQLRSSQLRSSPLRSSPLRLQPTPAQPTPVRPARRSSTTYGCPPPFRCCSCWSGSRSSSGCRRAPTTGPAAWSRAFTWAGGWRLPGCCSPPRRRATRSRCAGPRPPSGRPAAAAIWPRHRAGGATRTRRGARPDIGTVAFIDRSMAPVSLYSSRRDRCNLLLKYDRLENRFHPAPLSAIRAKHWPLQSSPPRPAVVTHTPRSEPTRARQHRRHQLSDKPGQTGQRENYLDSVSPVNF